MSSARRIFAEWIQAEVRSAFHITSCKNSIVGEIFDASSGEDESPTIFLWSETVAMALPQSTLSLTYDFSPALQVDRDTGQSLTLVFITFGLTVSH